VVPDRTPLVTTATLRARTHPPLRSALPLAAVAVALAAGLAPAAAQSSQRVPDRSTAQAAGEPAEAVAVEEAAVAGISPELSGVRVTGRAAEAAQVAFEETRVALDDTIRARVALQEQLFELRARDAQLTTRIEGETEARKAAAETFVVAREDMQAAAISTYTAEADMDELTAVVNFESTVELGSVSTYGETIRDDRVRVAQAATAESSASGCASRPPPSPSSWRPPPPRSSG
jgi:hypothetical protein